MLGKWVSDIHTQPLTGGFNSPQSSISTHATLQLSQPPLDLQSVLFEDTVGLRRLQSHRAGLSKVHMFLYFSFCILYFLCFDVRD